MNPWIILGAIMAVIGAFGWGHHEGVDTERTRWELRAAENDRVAFNKTLKLQEKHDEATKDFQKQLNSYRVFTDALIASLSTRPDPLPDTARADCKGATGAELSNRDSEFLARQAARAEEQRAFATYCQAEYDRVRAEIIEFNKKVE